jgi:hypothetical protein
MSFRVRHNEEVLPELHSAVQGLAEQPRDGNGPNDNENNY